MSGNERIAVIGLGYVGLPLAVAFARHFDDVVGFEIDDHRVETLVAGDDWTGEISRQDLIDTTLRITSDPESLSDRTFIAITVPTPIDKNRRPDLGPVKGACRTIASQMSKGCIVALESTVYPGVTEEICGPILAEGSGLTLGSDFKLAYSPERINPGDREHVLERIVKVVAAQDEESLERVAEIYGAITEAGVYKASSIRVAESAKVIENTQRDLNIALMNELSIIFDRLDIPTRDVLEAAGTKWNFLRFTPGLVGGHCIGVDPYYLTARAEEAGYHPEVILAGRRINDGMGAYVANKLVRMLLKKHRLSSDLRVGIIGLTFKEDVPDLRNTRVIDVVEELREFGIEALIADPIADPKDVEAEFDFSLAEMTDLVDLDALILAVPHKVVMEQGAANVFKALKQDGVLIDVKSALNPSEVPDGLTYWSL